MNMEKMKSIFDPSNGVSGQTITLARIKSDMKRDLMEIRKISAAINNDQEGVKWLRENIDYFSEFLLGIHLRNVQIPAEIPIYLNQFLMEREFVGGREDLIAFFENITNQFSLSEKELFQLPFVFFCQLTRLIKQNAVGNCDDLPRLFTIFHKTSNLDFYSILNGLSPIEKILRYDASGIYQNMTKESQRLYKYRIDRMARKKRVSAEKLCQQLLAEAKQKKIHFGQLIQKSGKGMWSFLPILLLFFILLIDFYVGFSSLLLSVLVSIPLYFFIRDVVDFIYSHTSKCHILPAMKIDRVTKEQKTCVVITSLIFSQKNVDELFEKLYQYSVNSHREGDEIYFGLLCDLKESRKQTEKNDADLIEYLKIKTEELNKRNHIFFSVVRKRVFHESENQFVGWERKRGAIEEMVSYLVDGKWNNSQIFGIKNKILGSKYLITLDGDTRPSIGQIKRLIGIAEHPLHRPVIRGRNGRRIVVSGYGILQPKICTSLLERITTPFGKIFANGSGNSPYASASYDWMQNFFSEGNFCGKGLICVEAYHKVITSRFPDQRILSHDMPEGALLRCGLVTSESFSDSNPQTYLSHYKRLHRWIRGDIQNLFLLSELSRFRKWFLIENILRYFLPISELLFLVVSCFYGRIHGVVSALLVLLFCCKDLMITLTELFITGNTEHFARHFSTKMRNLVLNGVYRFLLTLSSIVFEAYYFSDAIVRSIFRMLVTKKKLLEWQVYSPFSSGKGSLLFFSPAAALSFLLLFFSNNLLTTLILLFNGCFGFMAYFVSRPYKVERTVSSQNDEKLRKIAIEEYNFFQKCVTEKTNYLPPDNIQFDPIEKIAMRTSPTNIGLYLASLIAAYDLSIISIKEAVRRLKNAIEAIQKLRRFHGHLYNWYDLSTLEVIGEEFVSTVDSGNYVACLIVVLKALEDIIEKDSSIKQIVDFLKNEIENTDFRVLFDPEKLLFRVGVFPQDEKRQTSHYDLYMSEARTTSYLAIALGKIPYQHWGSLDRRLLSFQGRVGVGSWTGTAFEYFMPTLFLPVIENSLDDESLSFALFCQKNFSAYSSPKQKVFGISESGYSATDAQDNYQYFAFGVPYLSVKGTESTHKVISPYSSFLMLERQDPSVLKNLELLADLGMVGPFGYYEACEFNSNFIGDFSIVASYMAHHKGMTMLSLANALCDDIMQKRFLSYGDFFAKKELLAERFPIEGKVLKKKKERFPRTHKTLAAIDKEKLLSDSEARWKLFTDGKISLVVSSDGSNRVIYYGRELFDYKKGGIHLVLWLGEEKVTLDGRDGWEKSVVFGASYIEYHLRSEKKSILVRFELIPGEKVLLLRTEIQGFRGECLLDFEFDVILQNETEYRSHPAFQALSLEATLANQHFFVTRRSNEKEKEMNLHFLSTDSFEISLENKANAKQYSKRMMLSPTVKLKIPLNSSGNVKNALIIGPSVSKTPPKKSFLDGALYPINEITVRAAENARRIENICFYDKETRALEQDLLQTFFSEQKFYLYSKTHSKERNFLWQYGISGDFPMVLVDLSFADTLMLQKAEQSIRVLKKLILSGMKADLVIVHTSSGEYFDPLRDSLTQMVIRNQSEFLLGKHPGIHFVALSNEEDIKWLILASKISFHQRKELATDVPSREFSVLTKKYTNHDPNAPVVISEQKEIIINKEAFSPNVPFSQVVSNRICGFVCNQNSLGFTWYRNAGLGRITKWDNLPEETDGEKIYLQFQGRHYDLLQIADQVTYRRHFAIYLGKINDNRYQVIVTASEHLCGKIIYVSLPKELLNSSQLIFSAIPALGAMPKNNVLIRRGKQNEIIFMPTVFGDYDTMGYFVAKGSHCDIFHVKERLCFSYQAKEENLCFLGGFHSDLHLAHILKQIEQRPLEEILEEEKKFSDQFVLNELDSKKHWIRYQVTHARFFGRSGLYQSSGAYGFRDQLQDSLSLMRVAPGYTKRQIIRAASHQFEEGDVQHWWHTVRKVARGDPGIRSKCSDDYLWLLFVTAEYIEATGDRQILNCNAPFLKGSELGAEKDEEYYVPQIGKPEPLLVHLERAANLLIDRGLGKSHLPFIGTGDWNDGMNAVTGESTWLGFFGAICLKKCLPWLHHNVQKRANEFLITLNAGLKKAFNGCWFIRAVRENGVVLGNDISLESECSIDLITQAFSAFYELEFWGSEFSLPEESVKKSLLAAYEILFDPQSRTTKLFTKPFVNTDPSPGYIQRYCAGARENGGQYTHAAVWFALALLQYGRKTNDPDLIDKGKAIAKSLDPFINVDQKNYVKYQCEPYVLCGDIYTSDGLKGHGGWSWYTGSASWYLKLLDELEKF